VYGFLAGVKLSHLVDKQRNKTVSVVRAVEECIDSTQCGGRENCHENSRCMTHDLWEELNTTVYGFLAGVKLSHLVDKQRNKTVSVVRAGKSREPHILSA
jgi:Rrf2 family iron-sulfur cluster assembly transcriptional regulator